jgi:hypothetical protein
VSKGVRAKNTSAPFIGSKLWVDDQNASLVGEATHMGTDCLCDENSDLNCHTQQLIPNKLFRADLRKVFVQVHVR